MLERVALEHLTLAPNQRRHVAQEGIERLAGMLCRTGQLVPCIGHRPDPDKPDVVLYAGQRRLLAAQASHQLAGGDGLRGPGTGAQPDRAAARPRPRRG